MLVLPEIAIPDPTNPATSPWVKLIGMPIRVAKTAQITIAPAPAATVLKVKNSVVTIPLPMVIATAVPVAAPAKLHKAAILMAALGERVRVPITVAMALAASLKPLAIPKPIATAMTKISRASDSGMLQYDSFENISYIFSSIGSSLQVVVDFAPLDDVTRVLGIIE